MLRNNPNNTNNFKNYYSIPNIQNELKVIEGENLYRRKEYVIQNLDKLHNITNPKEKYLEIIKLVIRDNTNKKLLEEYLLVIKKEEKFLRGEFKENFEEYNKEIKFYYPFFTQNEMKNNFNEEKKSERENLLILFNKISVLSEDKANIIRKNLKIIKNEYESLIYFNQPLDTENNEELSFLNFRLIIMYSLKELNDILDDQELCKDLIFFNEKLKEIKNVIEFLNIDEIEFIIIASICTKNIDDFIFCFNCLAHENINYMKNKIKKILKDKKNYKNEEILNLYIKNNSEISLDEDNNK